ncbi:MAG: polysaccharide biosynthesis/export family protein [Syntrophaceae bacterium]
MKKQLTAAWLVVTILLTLVLSLCYAQDSISADPPKKTESVLKTDDDQYIIGSEDVLSIHVWREESLTKTVPVRMDGKISLPLIDDIQAAGMTPLQLKVELTRKLKEYIDDPTVTVTVMEANSFRVYVSGEVKQPGVHILRSETTLLKLIIRVGGFTPFANEKKIIIITKENGVEKRIIANYRKIIDGDEPDVVIRRGDTVIVK